MPEIFFVLSIKNSDNKKKSSFKQKGSFLVSYVFEL